MTFRTIGQGEMAEGKIAILGGSGMLGSEVALVCRRRALDTVVLDLPEFDITDEQHISAAIRGVRAIINCAAYTDVEKCESEVELAYKVNGEAVGKLGSAAKDAGIWVLHISTDLVFDGKSESPYVESDTPNPINTYGRSKLAGERLLVESGCLHCIIRVEWTYGLHGTNFITKLIEAAKTDKKLKVVDDQVGSPTATTEVAKVVCLLLRDIPEGLFHFASSGYVSRFDTAKFIFDKLDMPVDLIRCKTSDYGGAVARPLNSRFDCSKIGALFDEPIRPWQEPLESFLRRL